ncbi:MAG: porin [Methylobacillus sp.]|nr:porin [Methylobacillus sp.]
MKKQLSMAVAGAVLAMGASAANAGITIPAGDWTIDIGGNVNAFYTHTKFSGDLDQAGLTNKANTVQTGLLPSALGVGGKTRQNDLDIAFQFTFFTGSDSGNGGSLGNNSLNIRQAYMTFGDKSWGSVKMGRDLGIFGGDAILSDMTLLGVGTGAGRGGSSTLGRIGSGYQYADWVGQISYWSPNWDGFSFALGLREPWTNGTSNRAIRSDMGWEGKVQYEWAGDVAGKVWASYLSQRHNKNTGAILVTGVTTSGALVGPSYSYTSRGWDIGAKVSVAGFGLVGYYYDGRGLSGGTGEILGGLNSVNGALFTAGNKSKDKGGYIQGSYTIPDVGTKIGLSYGISKSNPASPTLGGVNYVFGDDSQFKNKSWIVGVYHPLTKSLNLVAEYTDQKLENMGYNSNLDGKAKTLSLGAIMFF